MNGSGIGLAFVAENLDNTIRGAQDIEFLTSIPVFGRAPHFKLNPGSPFKGSGPSTKATESEGGPPYFHSFHGALMTGAASS